MTVEDGTLGRTISWSLHFPLERNRGEYRRLGEGEAAGVPPARLARLITAYRLADQVPVNDAGGLWQAHFAPLNASSIAVLRMGSAEQVAMLLDDPAANALLHGIDGLNIIDQRGMDDPDWQRWSAAHVYDLLLMLAQATGALPVENPEAERRGPGPAADHLLEALDPVFGFRIDFPNPFRGEAGLASGRGVISALAVLALHQAWRTAAILAERPSRRVLEIGGGLGRAAYYCRKLGIDDYTIVDLPAAGLAQANWLTRFLPPEHLCLWGEAPFPWAMKMVPPAAFLQGEDQYDLIVNVNGATEFSEDSAISYLEAAGQRSDAFLSINHEAHAVRIGPLMKTLFPYVRPTRNPYWMKRGYVEEFFQFRR